MDIRTSLKNNPPFLLVVLLVAHLVVVLLNPAPGRIGRTFGAQVLMTIFQPFQSLATVMGSGIGGMREKYLSLRDSREENKQLVEEVAKLKNENVKLSEGSKITAQAVRISNWKFDSTTQIVPALVIARDATTWYRTITIDKGSAAGIEKDQPVITIQGLVGRVVLVTPNASRVLLLTDEQHASGAAIGQATESRILGVVQGTSNSQGKNNLRCELKIVGGLGEKPKVGELIVTSGQEGFYPKGIPIGKVVQPLNPAETSPDVVPIQPEAQLGQLDVVGVMIISKQRIKAEVEELNRIEQGKEKEELEKDKQRKLADQQRRKQSAQPRKE